MYKTNFSQQANEYDEHANVQKVCSRALVDLISKNLEHLKSDDDSLIDIRHVDIGCGTGRVLLDFSDIILRHDNANNLVAGYDAVGLDSSEGMLEVCKNRFEHILNSTEHVHEMFKPSYDFVLAYADEYNEYDKFNVITSNYALQWLNSKSRAEFLVQMLSELKERSIVGISYPIEGTFYELVRVNKILEEHERIPIIQFAGKDNVEDILSMANANCAKNGSASLKLLYCEEVTHTEWFDNPLDALRSIKNIGASLKVATNDSEIHTTQAHILHATHAQEVHSEGMHSLRHFAEVYAEHFGVGSKINDNHGYHVIKKRIPLTYHTLFLVYSK